MKSNRITDDDINKALKALEREIAEAEQALGGMVYAKRQTQDELLGPYWNEGWTMRDIAELHLHVLAATELGEEEFPYRGQVMHTNFAKHLLDYIKLRVQERN